MVLCVSLYFLKGIVIVLGIPSKAHIPSNKHANTLKRTRYSVRKYSTFMFQASKPPAADRLYLLLIQKRSHQQIHQIIKNTYRSSVLKYHLKRSNAYEAYKIYIFSTEKYSERQTIIRSVVYFTLLSGKGENMGLVWDTIVFNFVYPSMYRTDPQWDTGTNHSGFLREVLRLTMF